jgi:UDP-glucose 4-epimerase
MHTVFVTGSSGFIGGQIVLNLKKAGYRVLGIDIKKPSDIIMDHLDQFYLDDFSSDHILQTIQQSKPFGIIHCAGSSLVAPSMINPLDYYNNNVVKTFELLKIMKEIPNTKFIFSSSASVFGKNAEKIYDHTLRDPISPYGASKAMIELMLEGLHTAYSLKYVSLRYFNVAGADPKARHGQTADATHLIPRIIFSLRNNKEFEIYGNDFSTADGTCVRDYIHVDDLANAHILALSTEISSGNYNLGNGNGYSVMSVLKTAEQVLGPIKYIFCKKRHGDPPKLIADSSSFQKLTGWTPKYSIVDMIKHAWAWHNV